MKVLNIDYDRFEYPPSITDIETFISFISTYSSKFIEMRQFDTETCVFPYLVKDDLKTVYVNFSNMNIIFEEEATIMSRAEYDDKLAVCVLLKCQDCESYLEDCTGDNLEGHRDKLCLDGTCEWYCKVEPDED